MTRRLLHYVFWLVLAIPHGHSLMAAENDSVPKISRLIPGNQADKVAPGSGQLEVTFDRAMSRQSFSFTGGGESFPTMLGQPYWKNDRTCILPVRLEPGRQYKLGINSRRHQGFRSRAGVPATPIPWTFQTQGSPKATPPNAGSIAFDKLRYAVEHLYAYREVRDPGWEMLWNKNQPRFHGVTASRPMARLVAEMMSATRDPHIWLKVNGQVIPAFRREALPNANWSLLPRVILNWNHSGPVVATGLASDRIGYIAILSWERKHQAKAYEPLYAALQLMKGLPGLIIDVRFNAGGDERIARELAGCFVRKKVLYAKHVMVDRAAASGFSQPQERWLEPTRNRPRYSGSIAVLCGPRNMSSAEAFLLMMQQVPKATLIGSRTYGSSGNPQPHDLGQGVTVFLPSWKAMFPAGTILEKRGIQPDIPVKTTSRSFTKRDPVIDRAVQWLREPMN